MAKESRDPVKLLGLLMDRHKEDNRFKLRPLSLTETHKLNKNLPSSNSTCLDAMSIKIIKQLGWSFIPRVCHMINCITRTSVFPSIYKTTKIVLISKPGKPTDSIHSYRPINKQLLTLGKQLERGSRYVLLIVLMGSI